jgi:hypothetical protein
MSMVKEHSVIELKDYTLYVYVKDRRTKAGERLQGKYPYLQKHEQWMREEVRDLQAGLYPAPKYRLEFRDTYVTVKSLMTGADVQIRTEERGGVCDPSMERYWTM